MSGLSLSERELSRMAFREELFAQRGVDAHQAGAMADECVKRDRERLDMHFCAECARMSQAKTCTASWPGVARLDVIPTQFIRCASFAWQTPS